MQSSKASRYVFWGRFVPYRGDKFGCHRWLVDLMTSISSLLVYLRLVLSFHFVELVGETIRSDALLH